MINSNKQLQDIMDNSTSVIVVKDTEGKYIFINKHYEELLQKPRKEVIGKNDYAIWSKEMADKYTKKDRDVLRTKESFVYEEKIPTPNGIATFLLNKFPLFDSNGEMYAICVIGTDMTERKKSEEKIFRLSEELKYTNEDLENFLYTASHDLKHPISNLEGLMEVIKGLEYTNEQERASVLEMMNTSIERFKKTILLLEDMSQIKFKSEKDIRKIQFSDLIKQITSYLKDKITSTDTVIKTDFHASESIRFSERGLSIILTNLIDNAINFRDTERTPQIVIKTWKEDKGNTVGISVEDNGLGVELSKIDKIFSMLKRMHTHVDGMGLGLYIVKRIIENSGGTIEVESEVGKGSKFTLFLRNQ